MCTDSQKETTVRTKYQNKKAFKKSSKTTLIECTCNQYAAKGVFIMLEALE